VRDVGDLRKTILREAHDSAYSIHPGSTKCTRMSSRGIGGMGRREMWPLM
jgi:hypothetical protein